MKQRPAWVVPALTFTVAVGLAALAGPSRLALALRAAAAGTDCKHTGSVQPGDEVRRVNRDGFVTRVPNPVGEDFDPVTGFGNYDQKVEIVAKGKDGTVVVKAATNGSDTLFQLANALAGGNVAICRLELADTSSDPSKCCHFGRFQNETRLEGLLKVGPLEPFTVADLSVGAGPWEAVGARTEIRFDDDCNGVPDWLTESFGASADMRCRRLSKADPGSVFLTGVINWAEWVYVNAAEVSFTRKSQQLGLTMPTTLDGAVYDLPTKLFGHDTLRHYIYSARSEIRTRPAEVQAFTSRANRRTKLPETQVGAGVVLVDVLRAYDGKEPVDEILKR